MSIRTSQRAKRLLHLDLLRLLAIYLVIFNHTGDRGYMLFAENSETTLYFPYMVVSVLCKVAVPIFFMISGALLLPKEESIGTLFYKRIARMAGVLLLISVPYYLWLHRSKGLSITSFLTYIYGNSASTALWYLYSYIALLLMMPLLRCMVKSMERRHFLYLIGGYLVFFGILPCLEYLRWKGNGTIHQSFSPVLFLTPNIFYALSGYYLEHVLDHTKSKKRILILGIIFSVLALAVTCSMTHYQAVLEGECDTAQTERFFNCFICIPAMTLYCFMKYIGDRIQSVSLQRVLPVLGGAVFGVYLIEKFSRTLTDPVCAFLAPVVGTFLSSLIWCLATLSLSLLVVLLGKHTPGIKKVVNRLI